MEGKEESIHLYELGENKAKAERGQRLVVVGGGVSGITSALNWLRLHPENSVTLLEGQRELGGWVYSEYADFGDAQTAAKVKRTMETGARVLKNDEDAKSFYTMCLLASNPATNTHHFDHLVGNNPKCREAFLYEGDVPSTNSPFLDYKPEKYPLPIISNSAQKAFFASLQSALED
mmetsp:Transcript_4825/g.8278  ORF Transcript_4825/g.8278 Transcript_4825/m.8278 type:complete len:176 (+) Transcript_4825:25-552(+)